MPSVQCCCGEKMLVSSHNAGRRIPCPHCGEELQVPGDAPAPAAAASPGNADPSSRRYAAPENAGIASAAVMAITAGVFLLALIVAVVLVLRRSDEPSSSVMAADSRTPVAAGESSDSTAREQPSAVRQPTATDEEQRAAQQQREAERQQQREQQRQRELQRQREEQRRREQERQREEAERLARLEVEATKQVTSRAPRILRIAHPLADFEGVHIERIVPLADGSYRVVFDVHYSGAADPNGAWLKFTLELDADGNVIGAQCGRDTGAYKPGTAIEVIGELIRALNENP